MWDGAVGCQRSVVGGQQNQKGAAVGRVVSGWWVGGHPQSLRDRSLEEAVGCVPDGAVVEVFWVVLPGGRSGRIGVKQPYQDPQ